MGNARETRRGNEVILGQIENEEPPALPPRPQMENVISEHENRANGSSSNNCNPCSRKYVLLCAACGGLAVILGSLFAVLYVVLRSYTSSLHYFETVPSYVASVVLIVTGLLMLCFGWRRNRFGYLVKLCGACCLVCAVVCVVITVATTVVHMNRLQTLRKCVYNARSKSCTCFTESASHLMNQVSNMNPLSIIDPDEGSARYIFADTPDCQVIHGALYACLRALFGLSVIGILVSLFSGMLVYQLLGHERKKMYWEQLELRSRTLLRRHHPPPCCGCCQDCRFAPNSNNAMLPWPPWDVLDDSRYWSLHGGNLYSPGPCANGAGGAVQCSGQGHGSSANGCLAHRRNPAWNWLPWRPSNSENSQNSNRTRNQNEVGSVMIGPDDHYGFPLSGNSSYRTPLAVSATTPVNNRPNYTVSPGSEVALPWGPPPPYSRAGTSESGSASVSTSVCLSLAGSPDPTVSHYKESASTPSDSGLKENCLVKESRVLSNPNGSSIPQGSIRSNIDPRRMPWSTHAAGMVQQSGPVNSYPSRNAPKIQSVDSPTGRQNNIKSGIVRGEPESELYFADTSSYTVSVHNDGSADSVMYEEIKGPRYDTIKRPVTKATPPRNGPPSQRSSWDGQNSRTAVCLNQAQPRNRHSADTVGKEKVFSPIVIPKFINCSAQSSWMANMPNSTDMSSFVPYRRAAVLPNETVFSAHFTEGEVYENVTNLDFDDNKKPRTLSPDEEVAILTSQFRGTVAQVDNDFESTQMDSECDDSDSVIRSVNV